MTEQNQTPASTDDVEGHFRRGEPDRMEGWGAGTPDDDTQGHGRGHPSEAGTVEDTDDDTEGHVRR